MEKKNVVSFRLIELTLGTEINGYVKKAMIRVKVN